MKARLHLSVILALFAFSGCGSAARTDGGSANGGATASGGSVSRNGGAASGGVVGAGQGGSSDAGGATAAKGGAVGSGGASSGGASSAADGGQGGGMSRGGSTVSLADGSSGAGGSVAAGGSGGGGTGGSVAAGGSRDAGVGSGGTTTSTGTNPQGPCDLYQAANTPCGAAHSTVRALYSAYAGPLYQVQRASDKTTKDIMVGPEGFAENSAQDTFCAGTSCTIPIIYDQSPNGNHLRVTWFAYWLQSGGNPASATAAKITVGGHTVYGIKSGTNVAYRTGVQLPGTASITKGSSTVTFSSPQTIPANTPLLFAANAKDCPPDSWPNSCNFKAYYTASAVEAATTATLKTAYAGTNATATVVWNQGTKGIATGDGAEAMYSVVDGRTYNQWCCFDYGAAELSGIDEGNATMEALYFGACTQFGQSGGGSGPWVGADLENGMYEGYANGSAKVPSNTSITGFPYVTGMLKGLSAGDCPTGLTSSGCFALKAGNASSGKLEFKFNADTKNYGARPPSYSPQKKQGAIILASGGDGSVSGTGIWFEGAVTMGAPPDATDDAVQANIVALGYGK